MLDFVSKTDARNIILLVLYFRPVTTISAAQTATFASISAILCWRGRFIRVGVLLWSVFPRGTIPIFNATGRRRKIRAKPLAIAFFRGRIGETKFANYIFGEIKRGRRVRKLRHESFEISLRISDLRGRRLNYPRYLCRVP